MALEQKRKSPLGTLRGPHVLVLYLAGLVMLFVGERIIGGDATSRYVFSGLGGLLVVVACSAWLVAWLRSEKDARRIEGLSLLLASGGLLAGVLYLVGSDLVLGPAPVARAADDGIGVRQVLAVAWPILLACTVLPLLFVQWSAASMSAEQGMEAGRVMASARAGAMTATLLCTLFLLNAIADRKDVHVDLSYFKTTSASASSRELVRGMDTDTRALLFFAQPNEVLAEIRPYFDSLAEESAHFEVELVDRDLEPELAKEHRVSRGGTVVLARGESRQKIYLGDELDRAKRKLRTLDKEFQTAILKLTLERQTVYMITGHGERGASRIEGDIRPRLSLLKRFLTSNNLTVKNLGPVEGLSREVPDDAALVVWTDPAAPLFPGEAEALQQYLEGGGRMLITLDPDSKPELDDFLAGLGLRFVGETLAHGKAYIPLGKSRTPADQYNLVTNSFSSHPAVTTVSRYRQHMPVLFPRAGYLEKVPAEGRKSTFIVRSLPKTWADADGDAQRDDDERLRTYQLAAAVSAKVAPGRKDKDDREAKQPDENEEMRVVVVADTDVFSDDYIGFRLARGGHPGNFQLLADFLHWLIGEGKVGGVPESEEDLKIASTRDEDVIWFYGTVFAIPLIILGIGVGTRWGRGRRRRAG